MFRNARARNAHVEVASPLRYAKYDADADPDCRFAGTDIDSDPGYSPAAASAAALTVHLSSLPTRGDLYVGADTLGGGACDSNADGAISFDATVTAVVRMARRQAAGRGHCASGVQHG